MTRIESKKAEINKSQEEVFNFLVDFNNYEYLMPEGKVDQWSSDKDWCSFSIKGLAKIGMKQIGNTPNSKIEIISNGNNPFDFKLHVTVEPTNSSNKSMVQMVFESDLNPFIKMMVTKPLNAFFDSLVNSLQKRYLA
jgi:carbon monoxide dehydrogenase subunit G